jgi:hypothetical protein
MVTPSLAGWFRLRQAEAWPMSPSLSSRTGRLLMRRLATLHALVLPARVHAIILAGILAKPRVITHAALAVELPPAPPAPLPAEPLAALLVTPHVLALLALAQPVLAILVMLAVELPPPALPVILPVKRHAEPLARPRVIVPVMILVTLHALAQLAIPRAPVLPVGLHAMILVISRVTLPAVAPVVVPAV